MATAHHHHHHHQQQPNAPVDDTTPLVCQIQCTEEANDHIVYVLRVQRGNAAQLQYQQQQQQQQPQHSWLLRKRYTEFNELYNQLRASNYDLTMPPKKTFGNTKKEFLNTRLTGLQVHNPYKLSSIIVSKAFNRKQKINKQKEFMDKVLDNLVLAQSLHVKRFLDEAIYSTDYGELAMAHAAMFFRSEASWHVSESMMTDIGWRFRKKRLILTNSQMAPPNAKYMLTWTDHGSDKLLKETELRPILLQYTQINVTPSRIASTFLYAFHCYFFIVYLFFLPCSTRTSNP